MRIAFIITPNMLATSLTNAYELFFAANQAATSVQRQNKLNNQATLPVRHVELVKVAASEQRLTQPSGLTLQPDEKIGDQIFDMVYLPALWRNPRPVIKQHPEIVDWVRRQHEHGAIINSTGTGVCFAAEAGLLNGRPATTHWYFLEQFAKAYPLVQLKRQHFITSAANLYCAASVNALTDLTLHHVHRFFGRQVADHLSRHFSHEVRKPFDRLSFNAEENTNHPDELVLQLQLWIQNNLSKPQISIAKLAETFGMSLRNLNRRFRAATNLTPVRYLQQQRFLTAKELLQSSNLSIKEIAYRVGYLDVSYFTKLFKQAASITPKEYRKTVRAKLFSSSAPDQPADFGNRFSTPTF